MARVMVALSGGVDSAVAALLMVRAGHDVECLFMSNWDQDDPYCTVARDYQDARLVARELGVVLHQVNFADEYREQVFAQFLEEYAAGFTPNPDIACNARIKFGVCLRHAQRLGAQALATGHYARVEQQADGPALFQAADEGKDQTYFLHAVPRARFAHALFPLGPLHKEQVRQLARDAGLAVHDKPDSTGICFIGERPFDEFLRRYLPDKPGWIETHDGRRLGQHRGLQFYTLGQRGGLHIGGTKGAGGEPWYVARKDLERNVLIVVQRHDQHALQSHQLRTGTVNWLAQAPTSRFEAACRIRHRQRPESVSVQLEDDGGLTLNFDSAQRAATPGQFAVLYQAGRCLGGGRIQTIVEPQNLSPAAQASV